MTIRQDISAAVAAKERSQTERPSAGAAAPRSETAVPRRSGGLGVRDEIPKIGLLEYWYPAIADQDVPQRQATRRKPPRPGLAFFPGQHRPGVAITDWCPP